MSNGAGFGGAPGHVAPAHGLAQYAATGSAREDRGAGAQDGGLHVDEETSCYACGSEIRPNHWVRRGPKGTRHDTCP